MILVLMVGYNGALDLVLVDNGGFGLVSKESFICAGLFPWASVLASSCSVVGVVVSCGVVWL